MNREEMIEIAETAGFGNYIYEAQNLFERFALEVERRTLEMAAEVVKAECLGFKEDDAQLNRIVSAIRALGEK